MQTRASQLLKAIEFVCHCCRSGSGIQCFFDPRIRNLDPGYKIEKNGLEINISDYIFPRAWQQLFGLKILKFFVNLVLWIRL
jgi:hypothetical protein